MTKKKIAKRLKSLRLEKNFTIEQLAKKAKLSEHTVIAVERGINYPAFLSLQGIANSYKMRMSELMAYLEGK